MEIKEVVPKVAASKIFSGKQEVRIVPLADVQFGSQGCDVDLLKRKIKWALKEGAYFLGLGDYVDVASPGQRGQLARINLYDSTREFMDAQADQHIKGLMGVLGETKGRWLGMLRGHHYWQFADGTTSDTRLANALNTKFLGDCAAILLRFKNIRTVHGTTITAKIWCHHGVGSGLTAGAALNRLEHVTKAFHADAYLMGHQHRLAATKLPLIDYDTTVKGDIRWDTKERLLAIVGSFLKGYEMGSTDPAGNPAGSYVEKAMLTPTTLGCPMLLIRPRILHGYARVDADILL